MVERSAVIAALDTVIDPVSGQGLVAAGLVQGLVVADDRAGFALEVDRSQAAAYAPVRDAAEAALKAIPGMARVSVILTARPTVEEEAQADHRLYGVADAADAWSVGRWSRAAIELLAALEAEDRPAILVGGTGLYFTALTKGLADIPTVPTNVRNAVEADFVEKGEVTFRDALAGVDPKAASTIEKGDRQRLVRAMSVYVSSGRAISDWQADTLPLLKSGAWTGIVLEPDRQRLYEKCDRRVDTMLENNVLDEVRTLIARQLPSSLPAMKAVGIRELAACLMGEETLGDAVASLKRATRNYAKRQLTWFRNQAPFWNRIRN